MKMLNKSLLAIGALAFGTLAQAAIVTTWDADIKGVWTAAVPAGVTGVGTTTLSWGTPANPAGDQSSLVITNPGGLVPVTTYIGGGTPPDANIAPTISLTHNNFVINAPFLTDATLSLTVKLTPTAPPGATTALPVVNYNITFRETDNAPPCTVDSDTPCRDIFGLVNGFLNTSFGYDGQTYFVNAFPIEGGSLTTLSDAACADVDLGPGCLGFTTEENKSTPLPFGFTISTLPISVPEPGSLALMGLALAGLGLASRRRSAQPKV